MPRVPREKIEHFLNVLSTAKLIKKKLRWFMPDKKEAIRVEIKRLLAIGFIKVYHPDWLANPILVRKRIKNGECVLIILILTNTTLKTPLAYLG